MPIKRELYPPDWKNISANIRARANNRCEICGVKNHTYGARDIRHDWHDENDIRSMDEGDLYQVFDDFPRMIKIILTVAHLDQNPGNNDPANLKCLCQRCHLNYDRPFNLVKRKATWKHRRIEKHIHTVEAAGQLRLESLW